MMALYINITIQHILNPGSIQSIKFVGVSAAGLEMTRLYKVYVHVML